MKQYKKEHRQRKDYYLMTFQNAFLGRKEILKTTKIEIFCSESPRNKGKQIDGKTREWQNSERDFQGNASAKTAEKSCKAFKLDQIN